MVAYNKIDTKLSDLRLSKLKTAVKNNEGTTLRISNKNFNKDELPHELFLTQQQITKLRNKIENNMSADIKLTKSQIKKIIMSGGALGSILGRLLPKLIKPAISLGKKHISPFRIKCSNGCSRRWNTKKLHRYGRSSNSVSQTIVIFSNNEVNDMVKIKKALEDSGVLMKGVSETLKNDIRELH